MFLGIGTVLRNETKQKLGMTGSSSWEEHFTVENSHQYPLIWCFHLPG